MQTIDHPELELKDGPGVHPDNVITLEEAPQGYQDFDSGVAKKFVLNPHGLIDGASRN